MNSVWTSVLLVLCLATGTQGQIITCGLDIMILMDGSASLSIADWLTMLDVVYTTIEGLDIGPDRVNIGFVVFSTTLGYVSPQLSANKTELLTLVRSGLDKPDTGTFTHLAIQEATRLLATSRTTAPDVIILITDGATETKQLTVDSVAAANKAGITIYAIGLGRDVSPADLALLTDPSRLVSAVDINGLLGILNSITRRACAEVTTTPATTTTTTTATPRLSTGEHPCECALRSGTYNIPDNATCHRFWMCDKKDDVYYMHRFDCGPGTLFSISTANCVEPKDYNCPAWNGYCRLGQRSLYPHLCCGQFWECNNGTVSLRSCPAGLYFNNVLQGCQVPDASNVCLNDPLCSRGTKVCNLASVPNDPCSFAVMDNPGGPVVRPCQPGSAFNNATCVCSDVAPASCTKSVVPGVGEVDTSRDNNDCKALFHMDMTTSGRSLTVLNDYSNTREPIWVDRHSTSSNNGVVSFVGRALTDPTSYGKISDVVFVPYFAKRSFPLSWAFSLDFRFSPLADRREYVLVTNDNCLQCVSTYRLTASRPDVTSNVWTFRFWVQTADEVGYQLVDRAQAEITATVPITSNSAWSRVVVKVQLQNPATVHTEGYRALLSGTVSTASPTSPTNIQQSFSTAIITSKVKHNECGLSIGQGRDGPLGSRTTVALKGEVDDFKFYDCSDVSTLV